MRRYFVSSTMFAWLCLAAAALGCPSEIADTVARDVLVDPITYWQGVQHRHVTSPGRILHVPEFRPTIDALRARAAAWMNGEAEARGQEKLASDFLRRADQLVTQGVPYGKFLDLSLDFALLATRVEGHNPRDGNMSLGVMRAVLRSFKNDAPGVLLVPYLGLSTREELLRLRPVPLHFFGLVTESQVADGIVLNPYEFFFHDIVLHIGEMAERDGRYFSPPDDASEYLAYVDAFVARRRDSANRFWRAVDALTDPFRASIIDRAFDIHHESGLSFERRDALEFLDPARFRVPPTDEQARDWLRAHWRAEPRR